MAFFSLSSHKNIVVTAVVLSGGESSMQDCVGIRLDRSNETVLCAGDLEDCLIDREVLGISTPVESISTFSTQL